MSYLGKRKAYTQGDAVRSLVGAKRVLRHAMQRWKMRKNLSSLVATARLAPSMISRRMGESGFVDLASAVYNLDTTGAVTLIATVAQGAGTSQRIGKKIIWKSLQGHGLMNVGSTATFNDVAFLVVYDKRPTGSLPGVTDILNTASSASFNNDANSGRFQILKRVDRTMIGNNAAVTTGQEAKNVDFYLSLRNLPCVYKAAGTGAIGDIEEGALYLVQVGSIAAGTAAAALTIGFRTRYVDV